MAGGSPLQKTMRALRDAASTDSRVLSLTSLRRTYLDDPKLIKTLEDEEFCELCSSIIDASVQDDERLHLEACRTLDVVLPETKNKNFDFFQSILQINRKKRLKILVSLSILKDETIAIIASSVSVLDFLRSCMESIQPNKMTWLLSENAENSALLKKAEDETLNETDEVEEKIVEKTLELVKRMCTLHTLRLCYKEFYKFIMENVIILAYMGHRRQRVHSIVVLRQAVNRDLGPHTKASLRDIWEKYKETLQKIYCKRMSLLVNNTDMDWAVLWESSIALIGTDLHRGSGLVNSLLKVEELAFKSADPNRRQAFLSWKLLIDNFALDQRELATARRIKLLCVPLIAKNSKTEAMILTKLEVWWHLIYKVYPSIVECTDTVLVPFLSACFGPFGDKPLFVQKTDSNVCLGKKFPSTQIFAIDAFMQLIVDKENLPKVSYRVVQEILPSPVNNSVFETNYKIFIHCFGESVISLALLRSEDSKKGLEISQVLWKNLIKRIEEYDKMKVSMYKEIVAVINEFIKNDFHKIPMIRDFLLNVVLRDYNNIANSINLGENTMIDFIQTFLHSDHFAFFTSDHYQPIETLLWHLIKPKNANVYYPQTMELLQQILKIVNGARNNNSNMFAICEMWCILAKITKKYIEESQNINEGTTLKPNFKTIESIIAYPFTNLFTDDPVQLKTMAESWADLYMQFDFQAELIVSVKPNEILEKTSGIMIKALDSNKKCCDFAVLCFDALLKAVNYDNLPSEKEVPAFVHLLRDLAVQCLKTKRSTSERMVKAISSFLLRVFNHSAPKALTYLKAVKVAIECMIATSYKYSLDEEIANTWSTIVGLFKKLQKILNYDILNAYRKVIAYGMLHENKNVVSEAYSLVEIRKNLDDDSRKVLEDVLKEVEDATRMKNFEIFKEKSKKVKSSQTKPVGSFLNRRSVSPKTPSTLHQNGTIEKKTVVELEPNSQDFVEIVNNVKIDVNLLTDRQKELLKKRRDDIPALYNDLSVSNSQDSQELQSWFDAKSKIVPTTIKKEASINNNEESKTTITASSPSNSDDKKEEKVATSGAPTSPRTDSEKPLPPPPPPATSAAAALEDDTAIEDSQKKDELAAVAAAAAAVAPSAAKKLDFESREEFPAAAAAAELESEKVSPSIIDNKMRRRTIATVVDESNATGAGDKTSVARPATRRSLQQQGSGAPLRKCASTEQLSGRRGRKRRNSDSNSSESMLNIEREKRQKRESSPSDALNSSGESKSSNEENKPMEIDGKQISKRQLNEMSRLKIDMRFEPLPSRRSAGKVGEIGDKKSVVSKDEKPKDDKRRSSLKGPIVKLKETNEKESASINHRKDTGHKKPSVPEKEENKLTTRRSLPAKLDVVKETPKKKVDTVEETQETQITQEIIDIEDDSTQKDNVESIDKESETKNTEAESHESDIKATQDPDIVECSQDVPTNSKLDKVECFIKIKKVDVIQTNLAKIIEETQEKEEKEKDPEPMGVDLDESSISVIPATAEPEKPEKPALAQTETKKVENNIVKPSMPASLSLSPKSHSSSPKAAHQRLFRTKPLLHGRAAQMLGLVAKQSLVEKFGSPDTAKCDTNLTDEVTIVPLKKDKPQKETERLSSPGGSAGSRQQKMFSNMNNNMRQEMCSSPSLNMFCNLRNDGERISPKLDKHDKDNDSTIAETSQYDMDCSPNSKARKELPMLEWSNANPPSLNASPSASILKRMQDLDPETPNRKKKVSFADPPVSREMGYEIMTESSSPPKLEKLPTLRSPTGRKNKHAKLRLLQIETEKLEKENETSQMNNADEKSNLTTTINETINLTSEVSITLEPRVKLSTVLTEMSMDESRIINKESDHSVVLQTQDVDIFAENCINVSDDSKAPSQSNHNNSSIKLDSINLSNDLPKIDEHSLLEDTVDVHNISSSLDSSANVSDTRPVKTSSQQSAGDTLPVTDSVFTSFPLSEETQSNVVQLNEPEILDSTLPVYPSLISCLDAVEAVSAELVDPLFTSHLTKHLSMKSIHSVGDLAQLTERDVNRLPIKSPKITSIRKVLSWYEEKKTKTPDKRPPSVSSSTPLGKRREQTKSDDSFSSQNSDLASTNVSVVYDCKRPPKRHSTDISMQTSPVKRFKRNDEEACKEMMDHCDEGFLFEMFVQRFDAPKILEGYRQKMNDKPEPELKEKTLTLLGLSVEDDSEKSLKASTKTAGLQKVLELLPTIFDNDEEFVNSVHKAYKKKLKGSLPSKFSTNELLSALAKRLNQDKGADAQTLPSTSDLRCLLSRVSPDAIIEQVKDKCADKLTESAKRTLFKTLTDKLDACELADMYNEVVKSAVRKLQGK